MMVDSVNGPPMREVGRRGRTPFRIQKTTPAPVGATPRPSGRARVWEAERNGGTDRQPAVE